MSRQTPLFVVELIMFEDPQPGTRIDDFTIAYRITRGMNADVFAVWHHAFRTPLVCKRLRPADAEDAKWRRMLNLEGAALARLCHPGIVRLISHNKRSALPYLLLEHVGERTLRHMLANEGPLPVDASVRVVQHVGASVAYLHAQGFLHRDLKPSNIILRGGRPVLLDLGVVWKYGSKRRPPDRCGTPQYLAPEQIRRDPLTPLVDVYGLGVLLFELLTGVRPFRAGAKSYDKADASLAAQYPQLAEQPLTLRQAGLSKIGGKVRGKVGLREGDAGLEELIKRCLAHNPFERVASVSELLTKLDSFTSHKIWPQMEATEPHSFSPFA